LARVEKDDAAAIEGHRRHRRANELGIVREEVLNARVQVAHGVADVIQPAALLERSRRGRFRAQRTYQLQPAAAIVLQKLQLDVLKRVENPPARFAKAKLRLVII